MAGDVDQRGAEQSKQNKALTANISLSRCLALWKCRAPSKRSFKVVSWRRLVVAAVVGLFLILVGVGVGAQAWQLAMVISPPAATPTPTKAERIAPLHQELDRVWETEQWPQIMAILERIQAIDPDYPGLRERLFTAHLLYGLELVESNRLEQAIEQFDRALALNPHQETAQRERRLAAAYLAGLENHRRGYWTQAIKELSTVYELDPDYKEVRFLLYSAHYNYGLSLQRAGYLTEARQEYERALEVNSEGTEAQARLTEVTLLLTPPTPTPIPTPTSNKRIEIDISEQHFYAYEGEVLVYSFVCSTGEPGRDTKPGHYRVQSKIPEAYASIWDLRMPYWLGIYTVGKYENGIHALPIRRSDGVKMWGGLLGRRVSYGCIILSDQAAQTIYHWAELGIPVIIRY